MVQAIRTPDDKAVCLTTMINQHALLYKAHVDDILMGASCEILMWLKEKQKKLSEVESLRILAAIMRKKEERGRSNFGWFQPHDAGKNIHVQ